MTLEYIIVICALLISILIAIASIRIVANQGVKYLLYSLMIIAPSVIMAYIVFPIITQNLKAIIEILHVSHAGAVLIGYAICAILLLIIFSMLFYKKVQPKIALCGTYVVNMSALICLLVYLGIIENFITPSTIIFLIANFVAIWIVVGLNQPTSDYRKSWLYWPLTIWSIITIGLCITLFTWHYNNVISEESLQGIKIVDQAASKLYKTQQQQILQEINILNTEYSKVLTIEPQTKETINQASKILSDMQVKQKELEKIRKESVQLQPVEGLISSATESISSVSQMIHRDGIIGGIVKKIWHLAFGESTKLNTQNTPKPKLSSTKTQTKPSVIYLNKGQYTFALSPNEKTPWLKTKMTTVFDSKDDNNFLVESQDGRIFNKLEANDPNLYMPYAYRVIASTTTTIIINVK